MIPAVAQKNDGSKREEAVRAPVGAALPWGSKKSLCYPDDLLPQIQTTVTALAGMECHDDVLRKPLATEIAGPALEDEQTTSTETQRRARAVGEKRVVA
jgi:hypothetical protein